MLWSGSWVQSPPRLLLPGDRGSRRRCQWVPRWLQPPPAGAMRFQGYTPLSGWMALGKGGFLDKGLREAGTNSMDKDRRRCAATHLRPELSLVPVSLPFLLLPCSLLLWTSGGHTEKRSAKTTGSINPLCTTSALFQGPGAARIVHKDPVGPQANRNEAGLWRSTGHWKKQRRWLRRWKGRKTTFSGPLQTRARALSARGGTSTTSSSQHAPGPPCAVQAVSLEFSLAWIITC